MASYARTDSPSDSDQDNDQAETTGNGNCEVGPKRAIRRWTPEEHAKLVELVNKQQEAGATEICWSGIAKHLKGRTGKQCRHRWVNSCQPFTKRGAWDLDEEHIVAQLHASHGSAWSFIASQLKGRSENSVKNHYNALFRSKYLDSKKESVLANYVKMLREGQPQSTETYETALAITQAYRSQALSHMSIRGNAPLPRPPRSRAVPAGAAGTSSTSSMPLASPAPDAAPSSAPGFLPPEPPPQSSEGPSRLPIDQQQQSTLLNHLESFEWDWALTDLVGEPSPAGVPPGGAATAGGPPGFPPGLPGTTGPHHVTATGAPSLDDATIEQLLSDWVDNKSGEGEGLLLGQGGAPGWPTITSAEVKHSAPHPPTSANPQHTAAMPGMLPGSITNPAPGTNLGGRMTAGVALVDVPGGPHRTLSGHSAMFNRMNELTLGDMNPSLNLDQLLNAPSLCDLGLLPSPAGWEEPSPGAARKPHSCPGTLRQVEDGSMTYMSNRTGNLSQPGDSSTVPFVSAVDPLVRVKPEPSATIAYEHPIVAPNPLPMAAGTARQRRHSFTVPQDAAGTVLRSVYAGTKRSSSDRLGEELQQPSGAGERRASVTEYTSEYNGHAISVPQPTNSTHSSSLNVVAVPPSGQAVAWGSSRDAVFLPAGWSGAPAAAEEDGDCAFYMAPRVPRAQRLASAAAGSAPDGRKVAQPRRRHSVAVTSIADSPALAAYLPDRGTRPLSVTTQLWSDGAGDGLDGGAVSTRPRQRRRSAEATGWNIPEHLNVPVFLEEPRDGGDVAAAQDTHMSSPGAQPTAAVSGEPGHPGHTASSAMTQASVQQGSSSMQGLDAWTTDTAEQQLEAGSVKPENGPLGRSAAVKVEVADDGDELAVISNPKAVFGAAHAYAVLEDALMATSSIPQEELAIEAAGGGAQPPKAELVKHSDATAVDGLAGNGSYTSLNSLLLHSEELATLNQGPSVFGSADLGTDWLKPLGSGVPSLPHLPSDQVLPHDAFREGWAAEESPAGGQHMLFSSAQP